jgi:hypothetical protein
MFSSGLGSCNFNLRVVRNWYRVFSFCVRPPILFPNLGHELILNGVVSLFSHECSENAGLLALTKIGSRRVVQISAGFMIFFSILGKLVSLTKIH